MAFSLATLERSLRNPLVFLLAITVFALRASARGYQKGDVVPVTCLNRTIESGEHITDSDGNLQYIPFPTCAETNLPLSLVYGTSQPINCTITLTDPLFHLLEFYVHNDAPLSCRVPAAHDGPVNSIGDDDKTGALGSVSTSYTPLVLALSGTLQLSHLHVANVMNVVVHTGYAKDAGAGGDKKPKTKPKGKPDTITTAAGYSVSPNTLNERLVIGSELTLTFRPQWYIGTSLLIPPRATHATTWTLLLYMFISALTSATICIVYFRGIDLPRRLRFQGLDRLGGQGARHDQLPTAYKGYGYGVQVSSGNNGAAVGNGYGYAYSTSTGKKD